MRSNDKGQQGGGQKGLIMESAQSAAPVERLVSIRLCLGVFGSEWYAWATKDIPMLRVPCVGEVIERDDGHYDKIESVSWFLDGRVRVDCEYFIGGEDEEYGRNVRIAVEEFRSAGWLIKVPEDVTLLEC